MSAFEDRRPFVIGVVGDEPSFHSFLEMFRGREASAALVEMGLAAVTAPGGGNFESGLSSGIGLPVHASFEEMLEAHPDINLVVELTGDAEQVRRLRARLAPGVTLVEQRAARFFLGLFSSDKLWVACKLDLMQTQSMLKSIIDQLNDDILFIDDQGRIMDMNRKAHKSKGLPKGDLVGMDYREVLDMNDHFCSPADSECPFQKTLENGLQNEATYTVVDEAGRMQYFRVYCYPIFDDQGRMRHFVAVRRDITERTRLEQRMQQSEKLAAVGELSTFIAHEIRNPLFAISGFANSLLRMENLPETAQEKVNIILDESRRLDTILKSILNFSRPTQAKAGLVDVNQAVRQVMDIMRIGCEQQSIMVHMDLAEEVAKAKGDPELAKQCLINLVKNSMEAMSGGGDLTVRTGMTREHVFLEVEDTGEGIAASIRDKVFNPFFSTKGKGAGLGLAMIKKILDDGGGKVELSSVEGAGTTMTLFLPPALAAPEEGGPGVPANHKSDS